MKMINVTSDEVSAFVKECIKCGGEWRKSDSLLAFSFDGKMKPFIGLKKGYNETEFRKYLPEVSLVIKIKDAIRSSNTMARDRLDGRYFLSGDGIIKYKDVFGRINNLAKLTSAC